MSAAPHTAYPDTRLFIDGNAPILREKDILTPATADTAAKRIYLAVQLMYITGDLSNHNEAYFPLVRDFIEAAPSAVPMISEINGLILSGDFYKALKVARTLVAYEAKLLAVAKGRIGLLLFVRTSATTLLHTSGWSMSWISTARIAVAVVSPVES